MAPAELMRLHRRFCHPHNLKLYNLLKKTGIDDVNTDKLLKSQEIERDCVHCQKFGQAPQRFKFTIRDDVDFSHSVYVDILYFKTAVSHSSTPVIHVVDEETSLQAVFV